MWLLTHSKASGVAGVSYNDAVEEALCFGWIDSRVRPAGEGRTAQQYSPRRRGSPWSRPNKQRLERVAAAGLMAPAGQAMLDAAHADGSWAAYDEVEELRVPPDLQAALEAQPPAAEHWESFSRTARKQMLWWIKSAKRPETRAKRIAQTADAAAENRRALSPS